MLARKTRGSETKLAYRGWKRVEWSFTFAAAAYSLVRMRNLLATSA